MGKRKRMVRKCSPGSDRAADLRAEVSKYRVQDIYELPVPVLFYHRALRLQQMVRAA